MSDNSYFWPPAYPTPPQQEGSSSYVGQQPSAPLDNTSYLYFPPSIPLTSPSNEIARTGPAQHPLSFPGPPQPPVPGVPVYAGLQHPFGDAGRRQYPHAPHAALPHILPSNRMPVASTSTRTTRPVGHSSYNPQLANIYFQQHGRRTPPSHEEMARQNHPSNPPAYVQSHYHQREHLLPQPQVPSNGVPSASTSTRTARPVGYDPYSQQQGLRTLPPHAASGHRSHPPVNTQQQSSLQNEQHHLRPGMPVATTLTPHLLSHSPRVASTPAPVCNAAEHTVQWRVPRQIKNAQENEDKKIQPEMLLKFRLPKTEDAGASGSGTRRNTAESAAPAPRRRSAPRGRGGSAVRLGKRAGRDVAEETSVAKRRRVEGGSQRVVGENVYPTPTTDSDSPSTSASSSNQAQLDNSSLPSTAPIGGLDPTAGPAHEETRPNVPDEHDILQVSPAVHSPPGGPSEASSDVENSVSEPPTPAVVIESTECSMVDDEHYEQILDSTLGTSSNGAQEAGQSRDIGEAEFKSLTDDLAQLPQSELEKYFRALGWLR